MNFARATERLTAEDTPARNVLVTDAAAFSVRLEERRGIAGGFFVFEYTDAADLELLLPEIERLVRHANAMPRSMSVTLSPCSLLQIRRLNFDIPAGEMEVGMGTTAIRSRLGGDPNRRPARDLRGPLSVRHRCRPTPPGRKPRPW